MTLKSVILSSAFIIATLTTSAGFAHSNHISIINGHDVQSSENYAHYTVALGDQTELMCSGVIIAPHFVLTAGHCLDVVQDGRVYFGLNPTNFIFRAVKKATINPNYCANGNCGELDSIDDNDILLVEFDGDLPEGFMPVAIASPELLVTGAQIHLAGYGLNERQDYEDTLKATIVPFDTMNGVSEFRTDEKLAGSCNGDSGGPAFVEKDGQLLLAGLTSRGDGPCRRLGIYTMVNYFSAWIQSVVAPMAFAAP